MVFIKDVNEKVILKRILESKDYLHDKAIMILIGEKSKINITQLIEYLNVAGISFFGGIFPGLIYKNKLFYEGAIILPVPVLTRPYLIDMTKGLEFEIPKDWVDFKEENDTNKTAVIFVDGLYPNLDSFLSELYRYFGFTINYIGGGAGTVQFKPQPCVFTNDGFLQNAAVICFLDLKIRLAVGHGWEEFAGPIVATKTENNRIIELNWENALEVYKNIIEEDCSKKVTQENFFEIAKEYPLGVLRNNSNCIVRDILLISPEGHLVCAGEVKENSVLVVLKGSKDSLLDAGYQILQDLSGLESKKIITGLILNCISRVLYLGSEYDRELKIIDQSFPDLPGAFTIGEISSSGDGFLEFYNKTLVVGVLYE